ncbi:hypothetical protein EVC30_059 [Rhizobium phage RHph_Y1_11]|nr:hypothetical protein EVC30_059 [Rhizobium phage RHph_Y1_11]
MSKTVEQLRNECMQQRMHMFIFTEEERVAIRDFLMRQRLQSRDNDEYMHLGFAIAKLSLDEERFPEAEKARVIQFPTAG